MTEKDKRDFVEIGGSKGGGGGGAAEPRPPIIAADTLQSVGIAEYIDVISEGEIEGFADPDPLKSILLNDTPVKAQDGSLNFERVGFDWRPGTQDQTYITGASDGGGVSTEINVGLPIIQVLPITRTITNADVDIIRLNIKLPAGLKKQNNLTGDVNGTTVQIRISVKASGAPSFVYADVGGLDVFTGKASSAYERSIQVALKQFGSAPYDVKVERLTVDDATGYVTDLTQWASYTEIVNTKIRYPNSAYTRLRFDARSFSRVPSRGFLIKGMKVQVPVNYDPIVRVYNGTWDGTFKTAWTDNPAWVFYDLINNPRYGLGREITASYTDKWELYTIGQRCDELVPDGFGGQEPRYSINLYLQDSKSAQQVIQDIASNFSAMALWSGGGLLVTQDTIKVSSGLYTPANVVDGTFQYSSSARQTRKTVALVKWNDPADNYRLATEYVEDRAGIERYGYREYQAVAVGCTSRGQARRYGRRILSTSRLELESVQFKVGMSGIRNIPGDIIDVFDPLKHSESGFGGRTIDGSLTQAINIDRDVNLLSGETYKLILTNADGTVSEHNITNGAGTTNVINIGSTLSVAPDKHTVWSIFSANHLPRQRFRILWINELGGGDDGLYEISAVEYNEEKFAEIEADEPLEPIIKQPISNTNRVIPPTNLVASEGVILNNDGSRQRYIDISWTKSNDPFYDHSVVQYERNNGDKTTTSVLVDSFRIPDAQEGEYSISVYATNLIGAKSSALSITYTMGALVDMTLVQISNLRLLNKQASVTDFTGNEINIEWDDNTDTVFNQSSIYNTGNGGQQAWLRDYMIQVYDGATLIRTEFRTERAYTYTFDKNTQDNGTPKRTLTFTVFARDYNGFTSQSDTATFTNPPPAVFQNITTNSGQGQIFVEYTPPTDPDFRYVRAYASQTSGFSPDASNKVYEGSDRVFSFRAEPAGQWFIKLEGIDDFGTDSTVFTSEFSENSLAADVGAAVDQALADPGRAGDIIVEADRFLVVKPGQTTPQTAVFGVAQVAGVTTVAIKGDLIADGSILANSIAANTITADKMLVSQLSAISANMGTVTAGTFRTANNGYRVEISDLTGGNTFPIWYGTGTKNVSNGLLYVDDQGNVTVKGHIEASSGTFTGHIEATSGYFNGSIDVGNGQFTVDSSGNVITKSIVIQDGSGNTILSSGTGYEWQYLNNVPAEIRTNPNNLLYNSTIRWNSQEWVTDSPAHSGTEDAKVYVAGDPGYALANGYFDSIGIGVLPDFTPNKGDAPYSTFVVHQIGTDQIINGSPAQFDLHCQTTDNRVAVTPGKWYEVYGLVQAHRCSVGVYIDWQDADGNSVSGSGAPVAYMAKSEGDLGAITFNNTIADYGGNGQAGRNADGWAQIGFRIQAPAGAYRAGIHFYKGATTSGSDSYMFVNRPYFGESHDEQTVHSKYMSGSEGNNFRIDSNTVSTYISNLAIGNAQIASASIDEAKIVNAEVTTLKIRGEAVSVTTVAHGTQSGSNDQTVFIVENSPDVVTGLFLISCEVEVVSTGGPVTYLIADLISPANNIVASWTLIGGPGVINSTGDIRTFTSQYVISPFIPGNWSVRVYENPLVNKFIAKNLVVSLRGVKR